jgi:hypothetical protein
MTTREPITGNPPRLTNAGVFRHNIPSLSPIYGSTIQQSHQEEAPHGVEEAPQGQDQRYQEEKVTSLPLFSSRFAPATVQAHFIYADQGQPHLPRMREESRR